VGLFYLVTYQVFSLQVTNSLVALLLQVIKASVDLPAGSRISVMPQGAAVDINKVTYSTPERTNLKKGVYRVSIVTISHFGCFDSRLIRIQFKQGNLFYSDPA
jgi:hypothetical protein